MFAKDEKAYLSKIPASKKVSIKPFDKKAKNAGNAVVSKIRRKLQTPEVLFMGATALEIAGQNDIDIYVLDNPSNFGKYLPKLKQLLGKPKSIHKTFVEWEFTENGYPVAVYLTKPPKRHIQVFQILKSDKKLLKEYENLKIAFDGKSFRDYQKTKYKFYNKILKESGHRLYH